MGRLAACVGSGLLWVAALLPGLSKAQSPEYSPRLRARRLASDSSDAWAVEGSCAAEGACVSSPGFPATYLNGDSCTISLLQRPSVVKILAFSTESRYDVLVIEGHRYSGSGEGLIGGALPVWSNISWTSDDSVGSTGWQLCVEEPPSCDDGLPLTPVPISECPPVTEALRSCGYAEPGQLCEGDGTCGTRTDINNCYDQHYSYPASRDVYHKGTGTSRTVTTTTSSVTTVTSTTLTVTLGTSSGDEPSWTVLGDCQLLGPCVRSMNYPRPYGHNELCTFSAPIPSIVNVVAFDTERGYDAITVNGMTFSGTSIEGKSLVLWTNISWVSDDSEAQSGWEFCLEPLPSCSDGLLLTPVPVQDCPDPLQVLPDCKSAAPGELCEAGTCGTSKKVNNCYNSQYSHPPSRDVYRKQEGTTRTMTTTTVTERAETTFTATRPHGISYYPGPAPWIVEGDCGTFASCVESPHFPQPYGNRERCVLSLPQPSVVRVPIFSTEESFDVLRVNGVYYSGGSLAGESLVVWSNITWSSDSSVVGQGWQLCLDAPPYCSDGLGLVPVTISECPNPSEALPSCQAALPGELCEGSGDCGTRTDINNCYDSSYTYPASRDVYRKVKGTTSTTLTETTTSMTTETSTITATVTQIAGFWEGPAPWTIDGPCILHGACVESPQFPRPYPADVDCALALPRPSVVRITAFSTAEGDALIINGQAYSGSDQGLEGQFFTVWSNLSWSPSSTGKGWQVCYEPLPSCADGLPLSPAPVAECPPPEQGPPKGCDVAEPGELCLGDGTCGTRDDINNCYDAFFTYPPSLDVYRKGMGTTRTSSTMTSVTLTTSLTLTTTLWHAEGSWQYVGSCTISGDCAQTPQDGEGQCTLTLPRGTPVKVTQVGSSPAGNFSIDGLDLVPGQDTGRTFVVDAAISWLGAGSGSSGGTGFWEVCIARPTCSDGLSVSPLSSAECPASAEDLPGCQAALPGELCVGDGECLTYTDLGNCPPAAVYRKETGSTRTLTSTTSATATFTPSAWQVAGPCTVTGTCAQSPNYPEPYGPDERCQLTLPAGSMVTIAAFATELNYDRLTINGQDYSGPGRAIVGKSFTVTGPMSWRTDESQSGGGWQLCLADVRSSMDPESAVEGSSQPRLI